jgi:hypothetical protein
MVRGFLVCWFLRGMVRDGVTPDWRLCSSAAFNPRTHVRG